MVEIINSHEIKKTFQLLPVWAGPSIADSYGKKPVLDYHGEPVFAELYALKTFRSEGFQGFWADSYSRRYRTQLPEKDEPKIDLPSIVKEQLLLINPDGRFSGTWDLILWRDEMMRYVELKRKGRDSIRQTQIDFLERALKSGFDVSQFEVFEWQERQINHV